MKFKILLILLLLSASSVFAQKIQYVPDFGITDSLGNTYFLYDDVLSQNKTAVLVFFSATCGPCIQATSSINQWYNTYGQNQESVVIWAIEVSDFTDNADVFNFHQQNQTEYPIFNEQLSDSASTLFNVSYTPFYFVVCPTGLYKKVPIEYVTIGIDFCLSTSDIADETLHSPELLVSEGNLTLKGVTQMCRVQLYDTAGKLVFYDELNPEETAVINLKNGLYLYRLMTVGGRILSTGKIML